MPWCTRCDRFLNPNTVRPDGTCPACGRSVESTTTEQRLRSDETRRSADVPSGDDDHVRAPWHFWVMVAGVVIYLGWRLIEGVGWAIGNWF